MSDPQSPLHGARHDEVAIADGRLTLARDARRGETIAALLDRNGGQPIEATARREAGRRDAAVLDALLRRGVRRGARRSRISAMSACRASSARTAWGAILNAKTARSQMIGGIVCGHRHGAARAHAHRLRSRALRERGPRRVSRAGQRRHSGDRRDRSSTRTTRTSIRSASRASARSASPAWRRRSRTPCSTRPACASATCRSRSTSCFIRRFSIR